MVVHLVDRIGRLHRAPERQPGLEQLRIEQFGAERGAKERRQPLARIRRRLGHGFAQQAHDPPGHRQVGLGHQFVLAGVVVADQPHRDPRFSRDLADRGALETVALEARQGRLDQIGFAQFRQHAVVAGFLGHRRSRGGSRG
ncbi:hypothetical protein D3C71_1483920 [compost metagenome]